MSRRKDRERYDAMKAANPEYTGFRGLDSQFPSDIQASTVSITCTSCGRKRNVGRDAVTKEADSYICMSCKKEQEEGLFPEAEVPTEPLTN